MVKQIPNLITSLNILCGSVAVILAVSGDLVAAAIFALLGIFLDFFDGLAARLLNAQSEVGLQLDSLADVITSGLAPAVVMVQLLSIAFTDDIVQLDDLLADTSWNTSLSNYLPFAGLLIVVASAYRLAKFNVDTRQTSGFIGLPTPANSLLILSIPLILHFEHTPEMAWLLLNKWVLLSLTLVSCILLNMEVRLFAMKFKTWDFKSNVIRYVFVALSGATLIALGFKGIPVIIILYIVLSLFWKDHLETS